MHNCQNLKNRSLLQHAPSLTIVYYIVYIANGRLRLDLRGLRQPTLTTCPLHSSGESSKPCSLDANQESISEDPQAHYRTVSFFGGDAFERSRKKMWKGRRLYQEQGQVQANHLKLVQANWENRHVLCGKDRPETPAALNEWLHN